MSEERDLEQRGFKRTRREILKDTLAAGVLASRAWLPSQAIEKPIGGTAPEAKRLFPTSLPYGDWVEFQSEGFSAPVVGVIHQREYPAKVGVPLGGIGTGYIGLDTGGLFGLCSMFNSHVPVRGAMNWPFLGLSIGGQTWVLTTGQQSPEKGLGGAANKPRPPDLVLPGVKMAKNIDYWGHHPVADLEYETDAPVGVGLRAWSPFIPGDAGISNTPGAVFEVHLRNSSQEVQAGTLAFSFFGPSYDEGWTWKFGREEVEFPLQGVHVTSRRSSYVLGVMGKHTVRTGGGMGRSPEVRFRAKPDPAEWGKAWAGLGKGLPATSETEPGSTVAVDFRLEPEAEEVVRFVLAWYSPHWMSSGDPANGPRAFRHMYSTRYADAVAVAKVLVDEHERLLRRTLAWQQEIYRDPKLPAWLREVLLNMLHTYVTAGFWAAAEPPIGEWCRPEDGIFAICESPRACSQMANLPCSFFDNVALTYFFPQLALSTLRAEKAYQFDDGALPQLFGGVGAWAGTIEVASPTLGYTVTLNPFSYVTMVDRYRMLHGDAAFTREFYPSIKKAVEYQVDLNRGPDGIVSMPDRLLSVWPGIPYETEWLEGTGWAGIAPHVGGLHLAAIAMAGRMAQEAGDEAFSAQCRQWFDSGSASLENKAWLGKYYVRYVDPRTGERSDDITSCQLDGQLVAKMQGLRDVFRPDRVLIMLDTIKKTCVAATKLGTVLYTTPEGTSTSSTTKTMAGYKTTTTFMQAVVPLGLMYIYAGEADFGLEVMHRAFHNNVCRQGLTWYGENSIDNVTGKWDSGTEYTIKMILWGALSAIEGKDLTGPSRKGGLVERIMKAAG